MQAEVVLADGVRIPRVGLGTWRMSDHEVKGLVETGLRIGYRHFDTAALYKNERGIGSAIRDSGIPRDELFVTSKVWNDRHGYESAVRACEESLERLGLDHLDLYLIHWPAAARDRYVETWRALLDLRADGRVRSVGVSNFQPEHLQRLLAETGVLPPVNQVEVHPYFRQPRLLEFHHQHGIRTVAWGPLARGAVLTDPVALDLAQTLGRTPAQVVLRWHLELGHVVIPKSGSPERMAENFDLFGFALTGGQVAAISALHRGEGLGIDLNDD